MLHNHVSPTAVLCIELATSILQKGQTHEVTRVAPTKKYEVQFTNLGVAIRW